MSSVEPNCLFETFRAMITRAILPCSFASTKPFDLMKFKTVRSLRSYRIDGSSRLRKPCQPPPNDADAALPLGPSEYTSYSPFQAG